MNRYLIALIAVALLAGCSSAPQAADPTPTRAPAPAPALTTSPTPSPTPSTVPSPSDRGARGLPPGAMEPGTYFGESDAARFTFTVPASGWNNYPESGCCTIYTSPDAAGAIIFFCCDITSLYARACDSSGTEFEFGPTVDDLATALVSLRDFEVSEPTDVTLGGFHGKRVIVTVPTDVDVTDPDCDQGTYSITPGRYYQAAGQRDDNWILDVGGRRIVPTFATTPNTPAEVLRQVEQIRDSLVIEPR